jgi:alpha-N-arabinofuranosidase
MVKVDTYESKHGDAPYIDSVVIKDEENETLTVFAVNKDLENSYDVTMDVRQFEGYTVKEHILLTHDDLKAVNTEQDPDQVKPVYVQTDNIDAGTLKMYFPAKSWNVVRLQKQ